MLGQLTFNTFNSIMYLIGTVGIFVTLNLAVRQMRIRSKQNDFITSQFAELRQLIVSNHQDMDTKLIIMHETLKDIQANVKIVDLKIGDLTMRVNIAEVRLEERKPQQFMMSVPPVQQISMASRRGGRRPKATI